MATLVLTAVGSALGPVGRAVGALVGQSIDARLFGPKGREGPRLQDLKVQASSYGAAIPKLFGTLRVAGTVIWATDLIEHRDMKSGGKGRPSTTSYSYTASFAVLLSARAIRSVGRIWADGNLIRGAAGDWKIETGYRLHPGDEDQPPDPFIASAEAGQGTPAYRGCAYAVFENMALGDFGNRIPSLTFEVEADAGPIAIGPMLESLSGGAIGGNGGAVLRGIAASGESVRALVDTLARALPLSIQADGDRLRLANDDTEPLAIDPAEISEDSTETLPAAGDLPGVVMLNHYEPARDYQVGVQQARRGEGRRVERIELPAALAAGEARALADDLLARLTRERGRRSVKCGWSRLPVGPGALLRLPDDAGVWRLASRSVDRTGVRLDVKRVRASSLAIPRSEPGRSVPSPDQIHGPTIVHLLDLPNIGTELPAAPRLFVAAAGPSPGWRRASLLISLDAGASWEPIGASAAPATLGSVLTALPNAEPAVLDAVNHIDVQLLHDGMVLEDADRDRLIGGANLALAGREVIQFGRAEPLGDARWRLSNLVRGRRGTEWAASAHAVGERFVLIEPETLLAYDPPQSAVGTEVRLLASGVGDAIPAEANATDIGEALRPPPPVYLRALRQSDGGFDLRWIRRSRLGWPWLDGIDAPLGEDRELYTLTIQPMSGPVRSHELGASFYSYGAAEAAADRVSGPEVTLTVVQVGTHAVSRPVSLTLSL